MYTVTLADILSVRLWLCVSFVLAPSYLAGTRSMVRTPQIDKISDEITSQ